MADQDVDEVPLSKKDNGEEVATEELSLLEKDIEKVAEELVAEELCLLGKDIEKVDEEVCLSGEDVAKVAEEIYLSKEDLEKIAEEVCLSEKDIENVAREVCLSEKQDEEFCLSEKDVEEIAEEFCLSKEEAEEMVDEVVNLSQEDMEKVAEEVVDEEVCLSQEHMENSKKQQVKEIVDEHVCPSEGNVEKIAEEFCLPKNDIKEEEGQCRSEKDVEEVITWEDFYDKLEEEREASASAVTEALSMILRLQREKAIEKMEAHQYKRMAEAKIQHAEECLGLLKQLTHLKEMEITSLLHQLQTYQQKLTSIGVQTPDITELGFYGNQENSGRNKTTSQDDQVEQLCFEMDVSNENNSVPLPPRRRATWRKMNEKYDECEMLDLFYESEQGGEVSKKRAADILRAKESGCNSVKTLQRPFSIGSAGLEQHSGSSWYSAVSGEAAPCLPSKFGSAKSVLELSQSESNSSGSGSESNTIHFSTVHDIFEVPESHRGCTRGEPCKKELRESTKETRHTTGMPNLVRKESIDRLLRDDGWLHSAFMARYHRSRLCTPGKNSFLNNGSYCWYAHGGTETSQVDFEGIKLRLKQLEDGHIGRQEDTERGKKKMELLGEIFKELNTIETHMKSSMANQRSSEEDSKVVPITEVVLSFSI